MMNFTEILISWYVKNKRDLPWRKTQNPYYIWVSEVIMQQTRIKQGISYYSDFIAEFPDINSLAKAKKDRILKIWQGLGYYNRALNMHFAAKTVANEFSGNFPSDYDRLIYLKGIGEYTASAIASISGNQPFAVVDGNVTRVLSRVFGIKHSKKSIFEKKIKATATRLLDKNQPGTFNQALMEFGALQCKPSSPVCGSCIFKDKCFAYTRQQVKKYPPRKKTQPRKTRHFHYFIIHDESYVFIQNRKEKDIWKGLFEFPLLEKDGKISCKPALNEFINTNLIKPDSFSAVPDCTIAISILSHQTIHLNFHEINVIHPDKFSCNNWIRLHRNKLKYYAFPSPVIKYLKDKKFLTE